MFSHVNFGDLTLPSPGLKWVLNMMESVASHWDISVLCGSDFYFDSKMSTFLGA